MKYTINVNDTPEKEDYMLVVIIDEKYKTETSFSLSRTEKSSGQLKLIKSALAKVKFLNDTAIEKREKKNTKVLKKVLKKIAK